MTFRSDQLLEILDKVLRKQFRCEPMIAHMEFSTTKMLIIDVHIYNLLSKKNKSRTNKSIIDVINFLYSIDYLSRHEFEIYFDFAERNNDIIEKIINMDKIYIYEELYDLYEYMLQIDLVAEKDHFVVKLENNARDRSGSYYTAKELAIKLAYMTIDEYVQKKLNLSLETLSEQQSNEKRKQVVDLLENMKIMDMSCGTGHFLVAVIDTLSNLNVQELDISRVTRNLYGIDADLIALKILICYLIITSNDLSSISYIRNNIVFGNTLLYNESPCFDKKIDAYLKGVIYAEEMGIDYIKFKNQFDIIIGNPPWEKIRFEDKNFLSHYAPEVSQITKKNIRKQKIEELEVSNKKLFNYISEIRDGIEISKSQIKGDSKFTYSRNGELNSYALFTELSIYFAAEVYQSCLIVKSSLLTSKANQKLFNYLVTGKYIDIVIDFSNKKKIFPIDSRERFSAIFLSNSSCEYFSLSMGVENIEDIDVNKDTIKMTYSLLETLNPETKMIPNVKSEEQMQTLFEFAKKHSTFSKVFADVKFGRLVHLTNHSRYIHSFYADNLMPIYEGKFLSNYDLKYSTFAGMSKNKKYKSKASARKMNVDEKIVASCIPEARYFIEADKWFSISKNFNEDYSLFWRSLTSSTNKRTMIASLSRSTPSSQSIQLLQHSDKKTLVLILALFNSIVFDYIIRLKLSGIDLTQAIIKQMPVPDLVVFEREITFKGEKNNLYELIFDRQAQLYSNDYRLSEFYKSAIEIKNQREYELNRFRNIIELDYLISIAYGLEFSSLLNIAESMDAFYTAEYIDYLKSLEGTRS